MRHFRALRPLTLILVLGLLGCPKETAIWLAPGASVEELVFVLGKEPGHEESVRFFYVQIVQCDDERLMWAVGEGESGVPLPYPSRLTYGRVPRGFSQQHAPTDLRPGCYIARTGGTGQVRFEVSAVGAVREIGDPIS